MLSFLGNLAMGILEAPFFAGVLGSFLVLALTLIDDTRELLFHRERQEPRS